MKKCLHLAMLSKAYAQDILEKTNTLENHLKKPEHKLLTGNMSQLPAKDERRSMSQRRNGARTLA